MIQHRLVFEMKSFLVSRNWDKVDFIKVQSEVVIEKRTKRSDSRPDFSLVLFASSQTHLTERDGGVRAHAHFCSYTRHFAHFQCRHATLTQVQDDLKRPRHPRILQQFVPWCWPVRQLPFDPLLLPRHLDLQSLPHLWQGVDAKTQPHLSGSDRMAQLQTREKIYDIYR